MGTDTAREERESVVAAAETALTPIAPLGDLPWAIVQMRAVEPIVVNEALIAAYQAASSPHSVRALRSDIEAFDAWCRRTQRIALPATPEMVADYLDARARVPNPPRSVATKRRSPRSINCSNLRIRPRRHW